MGSKAISPREHMNLQIVIECYCVLHDGFSTGASFGIREDVDGWIIELLDEAYAIVIHKKYIFGLCCRSWHRAETRGIP